MLLLLAVAASAFAVGYLWPKGDDGSWTCSEVAETGRHTWMIACSSEAAAKRYADEHDAACAPADRIEPGPEGRVYGCFSR